jgi:signal transduction histidine kinase
MGHAERNGFLSYALPARVFKNRAISSHNCSLTQMKAASSFTCLTLLFAWIAQAAPPATLPAVPPDSAELTTAAAVRQLAPEQAAKKLPVRIRGVVTYLSGVPQIIFVQDATGGVCIAGPRERDVRPIRPGTSVEIEGVTTPGRLVPAVVGRLKEPVKITILAEGVSLPAPRPVSLAQLAHRNFHGDLVEVEGVVRTVRNESTGAPAAEALVITLASGRERIEAAFLAWHGGANIPANLVGATVKIRGVFNSASPEKQQAAAMRLLFTGIKDLRTLEPATAPFELPVVAIATLKSAAPDESLPTRARVSGVVTLAIPRKGLFLQGEGGGLWIDAPASDLRAGDRADIVGFPVRRGSTVALEDVLSKVDEHPGLPNAPLITPEQALAGDFDARLVRMEALVLEVSRLSEGPTLVLQSGERVYLARIPGAIAGATTDTLDPIRQNSWVRLTGVCVHNRLPDADSPTATTANPVSFHLLLNSPQAIDVIHAPGWWTLGRILLVCSVLAVITITAFAWVALLRLRVARQTSLIRNHLARETLYKERVRIARELHDSLEQDLLGISMQLNATDKLLTQPDRARESLLLAAAMVRRSQAETHRAVWDLRTNSDGLVSTLQQAVAVLDPVTATHVAFDVRGTPRELPAAAQNHVLRVALEAVTNALKHANPTRIEVQLDFESDHLTLNVRDDGRGFDDQRLPPPSSGHFGLFGMRERADKLQGQLTIQSTPGKGTDIQLTIPLDES